MISSNHLVVTIEATHQSLLWRLDEATRSVTEPSRPRDKYARTDAFMAATCRHLAAVEDVLVGIAERRLPDGADKVKTYLHQVRLLEQATARLKARLYGEVHAAYVPWSEVWDEVRRDLLRHNELELALVADLAAVLDESESDALAEALYRAEVKAPTRAHPYIPHTGWVGHVSRRVWAIADRFWDTAEGRMVPQLVRPPSKAHAHDSLMAQYLIGEPLLDANAPLIAHRPHHN